MYFIYYCIMYLQCNIVHIVKYSLYTVNHLIQSENAQNVLSATWKKIMKKGWEREKKEILSTKTWLTCAHYDHDQCNEVGR
jgi:hypothetical protein